MQNIPEQFQGSAALQLVQSQGWQWKIGTDPNIELEICPFCKKTGFGKMYIEIHGSVSDRKSRDGLFLCHHASCNKSGNLHTLRQHLGLVKASEPQKDFMSQAGGQKKQDPLPDVDACHEALLADEAAMDYLVNGRGFGREIIQKQKLGLKAKHWFRETGEVRSLVFPYLVNGNAVWAHYRTLPTMPISENKVVKAFASPAGWDSTLYNGEILLPGLSDLVLVEGECNVIAALDHGITNIVGVPGANTKKALWLDQIDALGLERLYVCYDRDRPGQKAAQELATRIGIERCWKIVLPEFEVQVDGGGTRHGKDLNEWFVSGGGTAEAFDQLKQDATLFDVQGVASAGDAVQEFLDELLDKGSVEPAYKFPWPSVNKLMGIDKYDTIDFLAEEKVGKLQHVDSKVLMCDGTWRAIGTLSVGDELSSIDGLPNTVTGVFPQGEKELFTVTFWDGRSTLAGGEHLWKVQSVNPWDSWKVFTTDALGLHHSGMKGQHRERVYVPLVEGKWNSSVTLPIDPWLLGALIGDGGMSDGHSVRFTTGDVDMAQKVADIVSTYGLSLNPVGSVRGVWANGHLQPPEKAKQDFAITRIGWDGNPISPRNYVMDSLRSLGLMEHRSETKFIPEIYLRASREDRLALLQGLMDTDGTAGNKYGTPSYTTVSPQLANDFQYLVRSLGGICKPNKVQKKKFRYKGEMRTGQPAYIFTPRMVDRESLFTLSRKVERTPERVNQARLTIESIEPWGKGESVCISVSHPSKLYVTDDFIVTHNTTIVMNILEHMVDTYGEDGVFINLEMTNAKQARKWVSHKAQVADNLPKTPEEAATLLAAFKDAIPKVQSYAANRQGTLYFCNPQYKTDDDIYKLIRDIVRRYGVKWVAIDNLQRLADTTPYGNNKGRTQHLSEISKKLTQLGKELGIQMLRILQPHRIGQGQMIGASNIDGSSQIAKDCDGLLVFYRGKTAQVTKEMLEACGVVNTEGTFDNKLHVNAALSRYSQGGETDLDFDGATSTVRELGSQVIAKLHAEANKNVGYENQFKALTEALNPVGVNSEDVEAISL